MLDEVDGLEIFGIMGEVDPALLSIEPFTYGIKTPAETIAARSQAPPVEWIEARLSQLKEVL
jgi:hypothetical protein